MHKLLYYLIILITLFTLVTPALSEPADPLDPFDPFAYPFDLDSNDLSSGSEQLNLDDENKSADQLLREALLLQYDQQLFESRSKLLKALQKDPKEFRAHMALSDYYSRYVGHFRLALKYAKQAHKLLVEKYGKPPYSDPEAQALHSDILNLVAQGRLNLDDYQGALTTLDEFASYGYTSSYFPSSKAWVLMKLGRLDEAINVARLGLLSGSTPGHTLNILGILLSMTNERQAALNTFQEALRFELSLGDLGNPSTPLNNSGEVYKEIFQEEKALQSWSSAIQLPDGCEHVLPSLNLHMLYMDALNLVEAKSAIDNFESCVAQYPLKNGEEHRALVKMARARIALHSGFPEQALLLLKDASDHQQWFGKIGTTIEDLQLGILASMHAALLAENAQLLRQSYSSWLDYLSSLKQRVSNRLHARWVARQARQLIAFQLNFLEDLFIRNTDSMIEYPSLGSMLATFPNAVIQSRIKDFKDSDNRTTAQLYYQLYSAESLMNSGSEDLALEQIGQVLSQLRPETDRLLKAHALVLKLKAIDNPKLKNYTQTVYDLLAIKPSAIINNGFIVSVNTNSLASDVAKKLAQSGLVPDSSSTLPIQINYSKLKDQHTFTIKSSISSVPNTQVSASDLSDAINKLRHTMFTSEL